MKSDHVIIPRCFSSDKTTTCFRSGNFLLVTTVDSGLISLSSGTAYLRMSIQLDFLNLSAITRHFIQTFSRQYASSSDWKPGLTFTRMRSALAQAIYISVHSALVGLYIPTRSPLCKPRAIRARAASSVLWLSSSQVHRIPWCLDIRASLPANSPDILLNSWEVCSPCRGLLDIPEL